MIAEDEVNVLMQGAIMIAGPILFYNTIALWQGILAGGAAKSQAWITFSTNPLTIFAVLVCAGVIVCFWTSVLTTRYFKSD